MTDDRPKSEDSPRPPGSSIEGFEAAVDTFIKLRDSNKFSLFVSRNNNVRFIGERAEFAAALTQALSGTEAEKVGSDEVLGELTTFVQMYLGGTTVDETVRLLEAFQYRDYLEKVKDDAPAREAFEHTLRRKIEALASKLVSGATIERSRRLSTAVGPSLEDLDVEIVSKRQSRLDDRTVSSPFLRIRLRYTEAGGSPFPYLFSTPWSSSANSSKSFEFECDEIDIDLLVTRLIEAKALLNQALDLKMQAEESKK